MKTRLGLARRNARPRVLGSDAAWMPRVGCQAPQVRPGICQRGTTTRQGERSPGPRGPAPLAKHLVQWHVPELAVVFHGRLRAMATTGVVGAPVTGMADGPDRETTEHAPGGGPVTRHVRLEDTQGPGHAMAVTVYGGQGLVLLDAATTRPLAVTVGKMHAQEARWTRALVTQARMPRAGAARLHTGICDTGCVDGRPLWWLHQPGLTWVVPATATRAVGVDARAQTVVGEDMAVGRRVHPGRQGPGPTAGTDRLATAVVGLTGRTPDDQDGTPAQGRQHHRRDGQPHPIQAVVGRQWQGKAEGPGGPTVFRTHASVAEPLQPCADDDDRRRMEPCCLQEATPPWDLGPPPQTRARAVRVQVLLTVVRFALATADRLPCARAAIGGEPVGWHRWRRQLREQTRDQVIVCAEGHDGIFHLAEYARLLGVKLQDIPPDIGSRQQVLAKDRLPARG